jgi:hypothetical protein
VYFYLLWIIQITQRTKSRIAREHETQSRRLCHWIVLTQQNKWEMDMHAHVHMSISPSNCQQATAWWIFMKFWYKDFFLPKSLNQIEFWLKTNENIRWFEWRFIYIVHLNLCVYAVSSWNVKKLNIMSCDTDAISVPGNWDKNWNTDTVLIIYFAFLPDHNYVMWHYVDVICSVVSLQSSDIVFVIVFHVPMQFLILFFVWFIWFIIIIIHPVL